MMFLTFLTTLTSQCKKLSQDREPTISMTAMLTWNCFLRPVSTKLSHMTTLKRAPDVWHLSNCATERRTPPKDTRLVAAATKVMYTNIDIEHCMKILEQFLRENHAERRLPDNFNIKMIMQVAKLIMIWNIFIYGNCFSSNHLGRLWEPQ